MRGFIEGIYISPEGGADMQKVNQVEALANRGLDGGRYCERIGYWSGSDECQVTLIEMEDLEEIERTTGIHVRHGEHRRNLITRGVKLEDLRGSERER
ncbi:hypothetical protein MYX65_06970 [Acidobacteria bacterium AH-259-L09]|nr:hypothetical protein [Acidobacteria bacterium AH-259-L09]